MKNNEFKDAIENKPTCSFCSSNADFSLAVFEGIIASAKINVCGACMTDFKRMEERTAKASRVRITSYTTGRNATGTPARLRYLLESLTPRQGFKSITSAIRITADSTQGNLLVCTACRDSISPQAPGFLSWTTDDKGKFHSIRLFHGDCRTNPGKTTEPTEWVDLNEIEDLDRARFTIAAGEMVDQIQQKWKQLKDRTYRPEES